MSEHHPYDESGFLPVGMVWVANAGTKPERILTSGHWLQLGVATHARQELLWRLNRRLKGKDPGRPINWKGLP